MRVSPQPLPATVFHRVRANFQSHKVIQMRERREVGFDCKPFEGDERFWFDVVKLKIERSKTVMS